MMLEPTYRLIHTLLPEFPELSDDIQKDIVRKARDFVIAQFKILPFPVNIAISCLTIFYHILGIIIYQKTSTKLSKSQHIKLCSIFNYVPYGKIYIRLIRSLTFLCFFEQESVLNKIYHND